MAKKNKKPPDPDNTELLTMSSYADIMTNLFGFFVILFSLSHMDQKKFYEFGKSISSSFKKSEVKADSSATEEMMEQRRQIRAFQMLIAVMNIGEEDKAIEKIEKTYSEKFETDTTVKAIKEGVKSSGIAESELVLREEKKGDDNLMLDLILPSSTMFVSGSDELTESSKSKIREVAGVIEKARGDSYIEVIGHTDSAPPAKNSRFADNWSLSSARASAVARELTQFGIPGAVISTKGKAHFEPLLPEKDKLGKPIASNMSKNRRVQIAILRQKR